jgi:hypothetical protein
MSLFAKTFAESNTSLNKLENFDDPTRHHPYQVAISVLMLNQFPMDVAVEIYHILNTITDDVFVHLFSSKDKKIVNLAAFNSAVTNMSFDTNIDKMQILLRKETKNMHFDKKIIVAVNASSDLQTRFKDYYVLDLSKSNWTQEVLDYVKR